MFKHRESSKIIPLYDQGFKQNKRNIKLVLDGIV